MKTPMLPLAALVLAAGAACAAAQTRVAALDRSAAPVPQQGRQADAIRATLQSIQLPPGFRIELYALVPGARQLAVAPHGKLVMVGSRKGHVWAVSDPGGGGAREVRTFAPSLDMKLPNGVCWAPDGTLLVAELNRVLGFAGAASLEQGPELAVTEVVPQGQLVPAGEESPNHGARTCRVSPDGMLYITLGQPYNVPPAGKVALYERLGIGGIVRMRAADGSQREVFARGLRNSVGIDVNPKDGSVWFTDNQTDLLGDDVPPGELNRADAPGQHFGYPYWNGHYKVAGSPVARDLKDLPEPPHAVFPQAEFPAHQAQLGMAFYTGRMFPARYQGGIFVAAHGSWNRSTPSGALVNFVPLKADGSAGPPEVFAQGWLANGNYKGRPVDVAPLPDGSLLISDDFAGAIYRVTYAAR